jgi:hypothetical protein
MRDPDGTTRTSSLAATATTLVALVAMAAAAPAVRGVPAARVTHMEILAPLNESQAMRALAGVVAAAARDLLARQQTSTALLTPGCEVLVSAERQVVPPPCARMMAGPTERLDQRLLDLPPPGC